MEEVERGFEPESSGQDQSFDDGRTAATGLASSDAGPSRSTIRQQPHLASLWDTDDGIVPSTPTLSINRQQEIGGAAHVPQGRFIWTSMVQEPFPSSQSFAGKLIFLFLILFTLIDFFSVPPSDTTAQRSVPSTPRVVTPPETCK